MTFLSSTRKWVFLSTPPCAFTLTGPQTPWTRPLPCLSHWMSNRIREGSDWLWGPSLLLGCFHGDHYRCLSSLHPQRHREGIMGRTNDGNERGQWLDQGMSAVSNMGVCLCVCQNEDSEAVRGCKNLVEEGDTVIKWWGILGLLQLRWCTFLRGCPTLHNNFLFAESSTLNLFSGMPSHTNFLCLNSGNQSVPCSSVNSNAPWKITRICTSVHKLCIEASYVFASVAFLPLCTLQNETIVLF